MWKPVDDAEQEAGPDDDRIQDVSYGIQEFTGPYQVVAGQVMLHSTSTKSKKRVKTAEIVDKPTSNNKSIKRLKPLQEGLETTHLPNWKDLAVHPLLLAALSDMQFDSPTPIQKLCIPVISTGSKDVFAVAETGSGKTLAYGLPILSKLLSNPGVSDKMGARALILTPTRELALQVSRHLRQVLTKVPLESRTRVECIVGGLAEQKQNRLLQKNPEVVVATLGRLVSLVDTVDFCKNLNETLEFLVIDEADRLSDSHHLGDIEPIVQLLSPTESRNKKRLTLMFSATLLTNDDMAKPKIQGTKNYGPMSLMKRLGLLGAPEVCDISPAPNKPKVDTQEQARSNKANKKPEDIKLPDSIQFYRFDSVEEEKEVFLHWLLATSEFKSIIIFVNSIDVTKRLTGTLSLSFPSHQVASLHAKMEQKQRLRNLERFQASKQTSTDSTKYVLIASDVAARGLDIPTVDCVVHFGVPSRTDTFVHRSGRCGRAGREGVVIIVTSGNESQKLFKIGQVLVNSQVDKFPVSELELKRMKRRVKVCQQLNTLSTTKRDDSLEKGWKRKMIEQAELEASDDDRDTDEEHAQVSNAREIKKLKQELAFLLSSRSNVKTPGAHRRGRKH